MTWALSDNHLLASYISPPSILAAAERRTALRAEYRRLTIASHRTTDLHERAALQASAAALLRALHGSAGFDGAVIALMVEGDEQHTYGDGDSAPLHCTVQFVGPAKDLSTIDKHRIIQAARRIADRVAPFTAKVNADAQFGDDGEVEVKIIEAHELNTVKDLAVSDPTVRSLAEQHDEHPQWIPHVSGLGDVDEVRIDRVAAMIGGNTHIYDLTGTQTPDKDEDLLTQGV